MNNKPYEILFLRLDPGNSEKRAKQNEEFVRIYKGIEASGLFRIEDTKGATIGEIVNTIAEIEPNIIHLSGHGSTNALRIQNHSSIEKEKPKNKTILSQEDINKIFAYPLSCSKENSKPCLVFINACLTASIANELVNSIEGVSNCCIIGMAQSLHEDLALRYAEIFYTSISKGNTVENVLEAFKGVDVGVKKGIREKGESGFDPQPTAYGNTKIKFNTKVGNSIQVDWHRISVNRLKQFRSLSSNCIIGGPGVIYQVDQIFIPPNLIEHKKLFCRKDSVSLGSDSADYKTLPKEEYSQKFIYESFLTQVLKYGQASKTEGKRIAIVGESGEGKTTLLQQIGKWILTELSRSIVIWVSLANLTQKNLEDYLEDEWLKRVIREEGDEISRDYRQQFTQQCKQGRVWLLLDGVDEIPFARDPLGEIYRQLQDGGWLKKTHVVLTCQSNIWDRSFIELEMFSAYRCLGFTEARQLKAFISKWFAKQGDFAIEQGQRLYSMLQEPEKKRIRSLITNPLRLTLLCFFWFCGEGELPKTQSDLYRLFVQKFYDWKSKESEKFWTTPEQRKKLTIGLARVSKAAIECPIETQGVRFQLRRDFLESFLDVSLPGSQKTLLEMALQLGWLSQVGIDVDDPSQEVYAFYHKTFQEYFAALEIDSKTFFLDHTPNNLDDKNYRIFEPQLKQTFLLWMGRKGGELEQDLDQRKQEIADLKDQKEKLIEELTTFKDKCKGIYSDRAFLLSAEGIAEFKDCALADKIIKQLIVWIFGHAKGPQKYWAALLNSVSEGRENWSETALFYTDSQRVIPALEDLLKNTRDELIRRRAAKILGSIDPGSEIAIRTLVQLLNTNTVQNANICLLAADSLGRIDPGNEIAIRALTQLLKTEQDKLIRRRAARILGSIDPGNETAIWTLLQLLEVTMHDADIKSCMIIVDSLSKVGIGNEVAIRELIQLLGTAKDKYIGILPAASLNIIGKGNETAIRSLSQLLETSQNEDIRVLVASSLISIGTGNKVAIQLLVNILKNAQNENVFWQAADTLNAIDPGNEMAVSSLMKVLQTTEDEFTRRQVADSLGVIDPENRMAIKALIELMKTTRSKGICCQAARSLVKINPRHEIARNMLLKILRDTQYLETRYAAIDGLGDTEPGDEIAIQGLVDFLGNTQDRGLMFLAANNLATIGKGNEMAVQSLVNLLKNTQNEDLRWRVADSLNVIDPGNEMAVQSLVNLLKNTQNEDTRRKVLNSLGSIDSENETAIQAIVKGLHSSLRLSSTRELMLGCAQSLSYPEFYRAFHL